MTLIDAFLVAFTSIFSEAFSAVQNIKSNIKHSFSRDSKIPIVRMFHEALKHEK